MSKFSSAFAEREYLRRATPIEVFKYLDSLSGEYSERRSVFSKSVLPKDTLEMLFQRNERIIDIGISKFSDDDLIEKLLSRNHPDNIQGIILGVAISEKEAKLNFDSVLTSTFYSEAVGGFYSTPVWLSSRIEWIAENCNTEQLSILFKNPSLAFELIDQILTKKSWCEDLDDKKYQSILWMLLDNKIIKTRPNDEHDYDMSQHGVVSGCLNLPLILENSKDTAILLSNNIDKFQELEIPYSFRKNIEEESSDWRADAANVIKVYLKEILKKWKTNTEEDNSYGGWRWSCDHIRSVTIEKVGSFWLSDLKEFIHSTNDLKAIEGYYAGIDLSRVDVEEFDLLYGKYGANFLFGLTRNKDIFLRSSKHSNKLCFKLREAVKEFQTPEGMEEWDTPLSEFNRLFDFRRNESPEKYLSNIYDIFHLDEVEPSEKENLNERFVELQKSIAKIGDGTTNSLKASDAASFFDIVTKKLDLIESKIGNDIRDLAASSKIIKDGINDELNRARRKNILIYFLIGFLIGWLLK